MKNLAGVMKQASQMQTRMREAQDTLEKLVVEGEAGNGLVSLSLSGKGAMTALHIDPKLADSSDMETLQDLIIAAYTAAKKKIETANEQEMSKVTGGLKLPPGLNLPF